MRFYGNGILRLGKPSLRFSKPKVKHALGYLDIEDEKIIESMIELGYKHDEPKTKEPTEKEVLLEKAISLGIEADGRWGIKKLQEAIEAG